MSPLPRRVTASALYDLYMCPARAALPIAERERPEAHEQARSWGEGAHRWWEVGSLADEWEYGWVWRPTEYLREIQCWYDPVKGRSGVRIPPAHRYYDDLPKWYLTGTADAVRMQGGVLEVMDLKTGNLRRDRRAPTYYAKDTVLDNNQLTLLAGCVYFSLSKAQRPTSVVLSIYHVPSRQTAERVQYREDWTLTADEFIKHFYRLVSNPLVKVLLACSGEIEITDLTNPGTHCYTCDAGDCPSRREKKEKKGK